VTVTKIADIDLVIVGAGGAGLTAAIAGAERGASVRVLEKSPLVGGTYAYSTGLIWMPNNRFMRAAGLDDSVSMAAEHIRGLSGGRHDEEILVSFLEEGPEVIDYLESLGVPFERIPNHPDYYSSQPGGLLDGRYIASPLFEPATMLPPEWRDRLVASPYYTGLPVSWREIQEWGGIATAARWDAAEIDRRNRRGARAWGSATTGYLLAAALARGVEIQTGVAARRLLIEGGRVVGVEVDGNSGASVHRARKAVILAAGGYEGSPELQRRWDPHPVAHRLGSPAVTGDATLMALEIGAAFEVIDGQLLTPTYQVQDETTNGEPLHRLMVREAAFPGGIVVNGAGRRFCDEAFNRDLCHGMARFDVVTQSFPNHPAYFICDHQWKVDYQLGPVRSGDFPQWLRPAASVEELAQRIGCSIDALRSTLDRFNKHALAGQDPDFDRGQSPYDRNHGDPRVEPNPCLRALAPPYYCVEVSLGSSGSNSGLSVDRFGRVRHVRGEVIPGLFAIGNTAANLVEGLWYNSGTANAKALVFGCISARAALRLESLSSRRPSLPIS
jgi:succinate dehydrogenase/fumarate reductase flavoprotein subunit